jgi:hypothetical protein
MTYTAGDFARALLNELQKDFDIVCLSRWAMRIYLMHCREMEPQLQSEVMTVVAMEEGPEFELTKDELVQLAHRLMTGEAQRGH